MRPQKVLEEEVLKGLVRTFRSKGYEGSSLNDLAQATGLKKASLYHRFPEGKKEMATTVLNHMDQWVKDNIIAALTDEKFSASIRLKNGISQISVLYNNGNATCVFRSLSLEAGLELFGQQLKEGMLIWITAFKEIGLSLNFNPELAQQMAVDTLIEIQGSLIVSKCLKDYGILENTLKKIEKKYIKD